MAENHLTQDEPTGNTAQVDADALLAKIESGEEVRQAPAEGTVPDPQAAQAPTTTTQQPAHNPDEYEFTWNGKQIKADRTKILQWANQGYDYAQKMSEFNKRNAEIERLKSDLKKHYEPFDTVEKYAKENPAWWNHVTQSWENRFQNGQQPQGQPQQLPNELLQKLDSLEKFKSEFEKRVSIEQREKEDHLLTQEVESIRKQYPNIDFDTPDAEGWSLEKRVMKHAVDHGINSFRAAFRDLRHDDLVKLAQEKAKEETAKTLQTRTKQGIIGKTQTPTKGLARAENVKSKSYDSLRDEALRELGIG